MWNHRYGEEIIKKSQGNRSRRRKSQLSATLKSFRSPDAIWHLFGKSLKHQLDSLLSERWQQENNRQKMLRKVPKYLHGRVEALVAQVAKYREELESAMAAGLIDAGFAPAIEKTAEKFDIVELRAGRAGAGAGKLVFNLIHAGVPGIRTWKECNELEWGSFLEAEMEYRSHYVTADRHHKKDDSELWNLYGRLPPWVARVAGDKLDTAEGAKLLQGVVTELAVEFAAEIGVDVVAIAVHRETASDLHLHLIFSPSREVPVEKSLSKQALEVIAKKVAAELAIDHAAAGLPSMGRNRRLKLAREKMKAEKLDKERSIERQRRRFPRPIQILGPSFRGKLALWEASGRDEAIARIGDRALGESNTFRERVSGAIRSGEDLTKTFVDLWLERRFESKVRALLTLEELEKVRRHASDGVSNYRRTGSVTPGVEDYIASGIANLTATLPEDVSKDLEKRASELDRREKVLKKREKELMGALVITDEVRQEFKIPKTHDARAILRSLVTAKEKAERRLKSAQEFLESHLKNGKDAVGEVAWGILQKLGGLLRPRSKKALEPDDMK